MGEKRPGQGKEIRDLENSEPCALASQPAMSAQGRWMKNWGHGWKHSDSLVVKKSGIQWDLLHQWTLKNQPWPLQQNRYHRERGGQGRQLLFCPAGPQCWGRRYSFNEFLTATISTFLTCIPALPIGQSNPPSKVWDRTWISPQTLSSINLNTKMNSFPDLNKHYGTDHWKQELAETCSVLVIFNCWSMGQLPSNTQSWVQVRVTALPQPQCHICATMLWPLRNSPADIMS